MIDNNDIGLPLPVDIEVRQKEIQADKRTDRTLELYNNTFKDALPGGIVAFLKNRKQATWVDLGCGDGLALEDVLAASKNIAIVGVDARGDVRMSEHVYYKRNVRTEGVSFSRQNLDGNRNIDLPQDIDLVTCLMIDRYLADIMPMILTATNSLSEDGRFLMTVSAFHYVRDRKYQEQEMLRSYLRSELEKSGGSLEVVTAGNKDNHLGDVRAEVWVIKKGKEPLSFDWEMKDSGPVSGGGYWQEYWVD